jgi:hypothetical protein
MVSFDSSCDSKFENAFICDTRGKTGSSYPFLDHSRKMWPLKVPSPKIPGQHRKEGDFIFCELMGVRLNEVHFENIILD